MFGTFNFKRSSKVQGIRHVVRPSIGLNYRPDLSSKYYYTTQINAAGNTQRFSKLQGGIYSGYSEGRTGGISFQLDNNVEMKMRSKD
ncbi:putative LPS assembly protein LptD, partial [Escherichia coli]|uniref:putative LPS assembly protein LptD n=1 Tax=Escherichia coli TaxID=562 RepID=UPI0028DFF803